VLCSGGFDGMEGGKTKGGMRCSGARFKMVGGEDGKERGSGLGCHVAARNGEGRGWCGGRPARDADTNLKSACASRRHAPTQNRGGGVAARWPQATVVGGNV
jgi:hypothetical protein